MRESLDELVRVLEGAAPALRTALDAHNWEAGEELVRQVLSAGSKLHTRCRLLAEIEQEARWAAEVDRAVHQPRTSSAEPFPGAQPLPIGPPEGKPSAEKPARRTSRKK